MTQTINQNPHSPSLTSHFQYYAIFNREPDGVNISFPDLDGAYSAGEDMLEAISMAEDLLTGWLLIALEENEELPQPSCFKTIQAQAPHDLVLPIQVKLLMK